MTTTIPAPRRRKAPATPKPVPPVTRIILLRPDGDHRILQREPMKVRALKALAASEAALGRQGWIMEMTGDYFAPTAPELRFCHAVKCLAGGSEYRNATAAFWRLRAYILK